ncbi:capsular exopolysaccharide synthesis family protein [Yoonia maricola]|uniref:non-specific protein-tyrosine kinase n=1 Tax=Yoonia maricola TaxID=420999 RepID=A0A2M8WKJ3_9RHOB|nr:AAA family ATPase [Yoonia maricola]PJI91449.1 capsular exopolysaccharide synthesis family protein [Yoonia maricola]
MKDIGLRIRDAELQADRLQQSAATDATTLADVIAALRRQYVPLLLCALLGVIAGAVHHVTTPEQYYTSATVLVDERPSALDEEITASIPFARNDTSLLNELQVLKSLQLATEVTRRLELQDRDIFLNPPSSLARDIVFGVKDSITGLIGIGSASEDPVETDPEQQRAAQLVATASKLQRDISVTRIGLSFSIEISYIGHDPTLAAQIVNTYADAYLEDGLNANVESTERTAEWMRNRLEELEQSSADVLAQAAALRQSQPGRVAELRELAQRAATLDALYQTISARYEQISIQGSFPVSNGRILSQSIVPKTAALPKLWQTMAVTLLLGLMMGFCVAVLREAREMSFRVSTDVYEHTGQTFLGHLPRIDFKDLRNAQPPPPKTKEIMLDAQMASAENATEADAAKNDPVRIAWERAISGDLSPQLYWSVLMPQSMYSDTLRNIHTSVNLGAADGMGKVVAVTSMLPDEGKTTLAVNYANMLAASGAQTLLIDMDLNDFSLSKALNLPQGPGIFEVLRGLSPLSDAMHHLDYTGLGVLPSGPRQQQPVTADVVYQRNLHALMAELRKHYDYVVLDMPALGKGAEVKAMIDLLDKIVLVCAWGKTPRSLVARYLTHEPEIAQKVLGIALNKVNLRKLDRYARPGWPESYLETEV